jgi:aspartate aminotransferase-like enzyme
MATSRSANSPSVIPIPIPVLPACYLECVNEYRLRLPGPTAIPERVRQAIARPVLSHRGPEFTAILRHTEDMLQTVMGTRNHLFFFASSGTGMMEAALVNILAPGERLLIAVNGAWGERFADIGRSLGAQVDTIDFSWGYAPDAGEIQRRLAKADYRAVVVVHNESSTGVTADLAAIGAVVKDTDTLLVVDSVSGLGGMEMSQDEWGVDILIAASQKCLMCPPGLGIVSMSQKAWTVVQRPGGLPRFYFDFRKARASSDKMETPFTPPVSLIVGLREALQMIHEEGLDDVIERHRRLSTFLQTGCAALGLPPFSTTAELSPTVVCMRVPERLSGNDIVRTLYQRHNTVITGSRNKLEDRVIRFGTMGQLTTGDIATDLHYLEDTLHHLEAARAR